MNFTKEQLEEIANFVEKTFGLTVDRRERFAVQDGFVLATDKVWWWSSEGPEHVLVADHAKNIRDYPNAYSITEPRTKVIYLDLE